LLKHLSPNPIDLKANQSISPFMQIRTSADYTMSNLLNALLNNPTTSTSRCPSAQSSGSYQAYASKSFSFSSSSSVNGRTTRHQRSEERAIYSDPEGTRVYRRRQRDGRPTVEERFEVDERCRRVDHIGWSEEVRTGREGGGRGIEEGGGSVGRERQQSVETVHGTIEDRIEDVTVEEDERAREESLDRSGRYYAEREGVYGEREGSA
jgi:hypothetical protein